MTAHTGILTTASAHDPRSDAVVDGWLAAAGCQLGDRVVRRCGDRVYQRLELSSPRPLEALRSRFASLAHTYRLASWQLHDAAPTRIALLGTREPDCLTHLIALCAAGTVPAEIAVIVSNHDTLRPVASAAGAPFVHIPVTTDTKPEAERQLLRTIKEHQVDLVVLARYMQILTEDACAELDGRIINIHPSLLPAFRGGRAYRRAFERGVTVVGSTAHYVTADLDEGNIICQLSADVTGVTDLASYVAAGRATEPHALATAVTLHAEHRLMPAGRGTVILR